MQIIRIKAHYLPVYNPNSNNKIKSIELLIDWDTRNKIRNVVNNIAVVKDGNPKSPLHKLGDDYLLTVNIPPIAHYELRGEPVESIISLLGNEIELEIKLTKYQLISKFESNKGQKIIGVSAKLVHAKVLNL